MTTNKRKLLIGAAAALVMIVAGTYFLNTFDWNRAKPWLNARINAALREARQYG